MKEKVTVAYRCPDCGVAMIGEINIFALMSGETHLRCSCGESVMSINYIKSRDTVSLSVPCVACPTSHPYQISASTFRDSELFVLQCSATGLDTAFIGDKARVIKAVDDNTIELQKLMEFADNDTFGVDEDFDIFKNFEEHEHDDGCDCKECHSNSDNPSNSENDEYEYFDAVVTSGMLYLLKELSDAGKIRCSCGENDVMIEVGFDEIVLSCDKCQARRVLRAKTDNDIIDLANLDEIILE